MFSTDRTAQRVLFEVGPREVVVDFDGGDLVSDAGLLAIRKLDLELGVLSGAAACLPDPRAQEFVTHSVEQILGLRVYSILSGRFDGNDAQALRHDPLFQTLAGASASPDSPLASGSTSNRFLNAYTRREAELPLEERSTLYEMRRAQLDRIAGLNEYLVDLYVRTRRTAPERIIIDLDPTDDPAHGHQQLTLFHGYYDQNQYLPLLAFDGDSRMPLGAWLRPGTIGIDSGTVVDALKEIVPRLKAAYPGVKLFVRGDSGVGGPETYAYCESEGLYYTFGYGTNEVLKRRTADDLRRIEANAALCREPWLHLHNNAPRREYHVFDDYQAGSWDKPRRIIAKLEITATGGSNRRFVVTNMPDEAWAVYEDYYCKRGDVPERPINELKNGLGIDRLSSPRFLANAQKMLFHVLAYALWALYREANEAIPEVATLEIQTARPRLFQVGAVVKSSVRRIWFHVATNWTGRDLFGRICDAVGRFAEAVRAAATRAVEAAAKALGAAGDPSAAATGTADPPGGAPLPLK